MSIEKMERIWDPATAIEEIKKGHGIVSFEKRAVIAAAPEGDEDGARSSGPSPRTCSPTSASPPSPPAPARNGQGTPSTTARRGRRAGPRSSTRSRASGAPGTARSLRCPTTRRGFCSPWRRSHTSWRASGSWGPQADSENPPGRAGGQAGGAIGLPRQKPPVEPFVLTKLDGLHIAAYEALMAIAQPPLKATRASR